MESTDERVTTVLSQLGKYLDLKNYSGPDGGKNYYNIAYGIVEEALKTSRRKGVEASVEAIIIACSKEGIPFKKTSKNRFKTKTTTRAGRQAVKKAKKRPSKFGKDYFDRNVVREVKQKKGELDA